MTDNIPKLLQDAINENTYDIDVITKNLKLPWLKLDLKFDQPTDKDINELITTDDWRKKWNFTGLEKNAYQVKNWNGDILFGPKDLQNFLKMSHDLEHDHDEDGKCRLFRNKIEYDWYVDSNNFTRQQVEKLLPDVNDINLVNSYILPPGGYVFPHRDYAIDKMGLAKLYVAIKWSEGNIFGQYGCGNIPVNEGDIFLINNYTLPHWVYNGSKENRIVIDISANLKSPNIKESIIRAFKNNYRSH